MEAQKDKKNWAEMEDEADAEEEFGINKDEKKAEPVVKKAGPAASKNSQGDFIVTSFNVDDTTNLSKKDAETKVNNNEGIELESDDSGYGEEEDKEGEAVEAIPEEPKKKEGKYIFTDKSLEVKTLSKKEKKAQEDAELDALLGNMTVKEEKKEAPQAAASVVAGSNNAKNKKKKEKKKLAEQKAKEEEAKKDEKAEEIDPQEAARIAMAKRAGKHQEDKSGLDRNALASHVKAEKEKQGKKKEKKHGATPIF